MNIHLRQLFIFCSIDLLFYLISYFIWGDSIGSSPEITMTIFFTPMILTGIMTKTLNNISWTKTIAWTSILVFSSCFCVIIVNLINPLNRTITVEEYKIGIIRDLFTHTFFILPISLAIAFFVRKRTILQEKKSI